MRWTRNQAEDRGNLGAHGLDFNAAALVFDDPMSATREDPYPHEQRWRTMGMVGNQVVIVVHTWPAFDEETGEAIGRIISARKATSYERMAYEEGLD